MLEESLAADARAEGVEKLVVGAVVHDGGRVLVVTRSAADDFLPGVDELPSGGVDEGESLVAGLNRELLEEVGVAADVVDDGFLAQFDYVTASGRTARQFTVSVPLRDGVVRLSDEHTALRWVASDDLDSVSLTPETRSVVAGWFAWTSRSSTV